MASGSSPAGSSSGVVQNSALSFLASAQTAKAPDILPDGEPVTQSGRLMPAGLKALCEACSRVYPDQPNPLQVTTRLKYWLGGSDPLDYISMYWNPGRPEENVPPHWHYISFGLSDLHGDGRVHPEPELSRAARSGFGLELTLRLAAEGAPPLWPAALLQALARYVFATGNRFCAGDHISWHAPLDGARSRVRHLLVAPDPQLSDVDTPHGTVCFLQMVGCTSRELRAAQRGSGFEVLKLISEDPRCGGPWLVTRVSRRSSARRLHTAGGGARPAELAGVSAAVSWHAYVPEPEENPSPPLSPSVERQIKETLQRGLSTMSDGRVQGHNMSTDSFEMSSIERALPQIPDTMQDSWQTQDSIEYLDGVHLFMDGEAASLLPLAIDGRVAHGRHFTWREAGGGGGGAGGGGLGAERAVTVLAASVLGAFATPQRPYARRGNWLQIVIPKELAAEMSAQVGVFSQLAMTDTESDDGEEPRVAADAIPRTLCWPRHRLRITVL